MPSMGELDLSWVQSTFFRAVLVAITLVGGRGQEVQGLELTLGVWRRSSVQQSPSPL